MAKRGQPTKYKSEFVEQVHKLAAGGFLDKQIADFFKISEATLNTWKQKHPEFFESLQKGKDDFDSTKVESSLLKRALGFKYTETTREISPKANPKTGGVQLRITKRVTKMVVPDVTAQIFWLKNRQKGRWQDVQQHQVGGMIRLVAEPMKKPKDAGT
jgi:hypothetical protein